MTPGMDLLEQFERVIEALDAAGIAYALCGGLAVNVYGHVRATMDIDLLLRPEAVDRARSRRCDQLDTTSMRAPSPSTSAARTNARFDASRAWTTGTFSASIW
jgi:hypothetical protein